MAEAGDFKADLLDRLSFEVLFVPSLRQRGRGDIELLTRHFATQMSAELGLPGPPEWSDTALKALGEHDWPGNVRELKNVVERAVSRAEGGCVQDLVFDPFRAPSGFKPPKASISKAVLPASVAISSQPCALPVDLFALVADLEKRLLEQALTQARFRQREAATLLGLSYDQFRGLYRKHQADLQKGTQTVQTV